MSDFLDALRQVIPLHPIFLLAFVLSAAAATFLYKFFQTVPEASFRDVVSSRGFISSFGAALLAIWGSSFAWIEFQHPPEDRLRVAVATFQGNSDAAMSEGRGFGALVRQEVAKRVRDGEEIELVDPTDAPLAADCAAAKDYGESVLAHLVLTGEVILVGKELRIHPILCVVFDYGTASANVPAPVLAAAIDTPNRITFADTHAHDIADVISGISGIASFQRAEFSQAVSTLSPISDKTTEILEYLSAAYVYLQQFDQAESAAREAVALEPESIDALNLLGVSLFYQHRLDEAESALGQAEPKGTSEVLANLAAVALSRGNFNTALDLYEKALAVAPEDPPRKRQTIELDMVTTYLSLGRPADAEAAARRVNAEAPRWPIVHNLLGRALRDQRRYEAAYAEFQIAIGLDANYAVAINNAGETAFRLGRADEAIRLFKQAIDIKPDYTHAYNNLGFVLTRQGKFSEAEQALKKATEIDPNYRDAWSNLAHLYRLTNQEEERAAAQRRLDELGHTGHAGSGLPVLAPPRAD
jgi:tetratricopeptide (TPR) repeat protein